MRRGLPSLLLLLCAAAPRNDVSIVVASVDIPAGTVVTFDMISQRKVPAAVVTSSIVKPDSASYVVNQKIVFPVLAGDALYWSEFETTKDKVAASTCARVMPAASGTAPEQVARARTVALE